MVVLLVRRMRAWNGSRAQNGFSGVLADWIGHFGDRNGALDQHPDTRLRWLR